MQLALNLREKVLQPELLLGKAALQLRARLLKEGLLDVVQSTEELAAKIKHYCSEHCQFLQIKPPYLLLFGPSLAWVSSRLAGALAVLHGLADKHWASWNAEFYKRLLERAKKKCYDIKYYVYSKLYFYIFSKENVQRARQLYCSLLSRNSFLAQHPEVVRWLFILKYYIYPISIINVFLSVLELGKLAEAVAAEPEKYGAERLGDSLVVWQAEYELKITRQEKARKVQVSFKQSSFLDAVLLEISWEMQPLVRIKLLPKLPVAPERCCIELEIRGELGSNIFDALISAARWLEKFRQDLLAYIDQVVAAFPNTEKFMQEYLKRDMRIYEARPDDPDAASIPRLAELKGKNCSMLATLDELWPRCRLIYCVPKDSFQKSFAEQILQEQVNGCKVVIALTHDLRIFFADLYNRIDFKRLFAVLESENLVYPLASYRLARLFKRKETREAYKKLIKYGFYLDIETPYDNYII
ncbi:MAG: hypothetical protein GXO42_00905 [bacterium]|nr:hypothetical protein [bacterium]